MLAHAFHVPWAHLLESDEYVLKMSCFVRMAISYVHIIHLILHIIIIIYVLTIVEYFTRFRSNVGQQF